VPHLEQLPDHDRLEHGADPAGRHAERVRGEDELVEPREEGAMLEGHADEGVDILLDRQVDADAQGLRLAPAGRGALVGGPHQPGPAAGDAVAAERGQRAGHALRLLVGEAAGRRPRRTG